MLNALEIKSEIQPDITLPVVVQRGEMPNEPNDEHVIFKNPLTTSVAEITEELQETEQIKEAEKENEKCTCDIGTLCGYCIKMGQILKREGKRGFYFKGKLFESKKSEE